MVIYARIKLHTFTFICILEIYSHSYKKWAPHQFQSTLQIWPLRKKVEFLVAQNASFEHPQRPNAICVIWNLTATIIFSTLRFFYVKMTTCEERGGGMWVCISLVVAGPLCLAKMTKVDTSVKLYTTLPSLMVKERRTYIPFKKPSADKERQFNVLRF